MSELRLTLSHGPQEKQLDHASKATTFVHQAFGSYLRSQVCRLLE